MLVQRGRLAFAVCCSLYLSGCSDPSVDPALQTSGAGGGGSSAGALGAAGAGAGGVGSAGSASAGASGGGSSPALACSSYMDASGWTLLVQITNQRKQPVYLGQTEEGCDTPGLFRVADGARVSLPSLAGCHDSCQQLMQSGPVACPTACAPPSSVTLQPGETIKIPWDGRYAVPQTLPPQCLSAAAQGTSSCVQAARIEAALFTFSARGGTTQRCLAASASCSCTPNQNGGCTTAASVISGTITTTEYLVKLEPGEISPGGEPPFIGLVFKE